MSSQERIVLLLLAALNFTHIMDFMIMMPLGNFLMPYFNLTSQQFSLLVAAYTFSAGISGFAAAFFVDNYDRKRVLLFAYCGFLIGTLCCALAPSYLFLLTSRVVAGLFGGLISAQVLAIVADLVPYERRASAMGMIMAAFSLASVFGVPFGLYLANHLNWHAPFVFVVGLGLLLVPFLLRLLPSMSGHIHSDKPRTTPMALLQSVGSDPNQLLALGLTACLMLGHFLIIPFLNPFLEYNMGYSKSQTPMVYLVGGVLTFFSSPILGKLADRTGKHKLFFVMVLMAAVPIWLITNLQPIPFYLVLCITGFWFVISSGRSIPAQAMISNVVAPERRGSFMSFNSSVQQITVGIASIVSGAIVVRTSKNQVLHYDVTGYLSIVIILISLVFAHFLNARTNAENQTKPEASK